MTDLEIMDWLEEKGYMESKCVKIRVAACVRKHNWDLPGPMCLNSPASKMLECKKCERERFALGEKDYMCPAVHAELKAILYAVYELTPYENLKRDYDLFTTLFPCKNCTLLSIHVGMAKIFYRHDYYNREKEEGREAIRYTELFLEKSGVKLIKI